MAPRERIAVPPPDQQVPQWIAPAPHGGIPLIMHRVWFDLGGNPEPPAERYGEARASFAQHHRVLQPAPTALADWATVREYLGRMAPDGMWKCVEWGRDAAEGFVQEVFPWFWDCWRTYREAIFQIDGIRYLLLAALGGVYADMDLTFLRDISPAIANRQVVLVRINDPVHWRARPAITVFNNYFMAGIPGHEFALHTIRRLVRMHSSPMHIAKSALATMEVAGPWFLRRAVHTYEAADQITVLPPEAFEQRRIRRLASAGGVDDRDVAYGVHGYFGTWGISEKTVWDAIRGLTVCVVIIAVAYAIAAIEWWRGRRQRLAACSTTDEVRNETCNVT